MNDEDKFDEFFNVFHSILYRIRENRKQNNKGCTINDLWTSEEVKLTVLDSEIHKAVIDYLSDNLNTEVKA